MGMGTAFQWIRLLLCFSLQLDPSSKRNLWMIICVLCVLRVSVVKFIVSHSAPAFLKTRICTQATKQINGSINMA